MNYYRRYVADYGSKTSANSMIEDGAYTRLLDWYYEHEGPLPAELARVYTIARAMSPAERKAVQHVLSAYFEKRVDGYHNARADEELAIALPALANLRRVARENGKRGGRPKSESGSYPQPMQEPNPVPESDAERGADSDPNRKASSQPLNLSNTASTVLDTSRPCGQKAAGEENPEPPPPSEARIAGLSALLTRAKVSDVQTCKPLMERWLSRASDAQITRAVNDACRSKGGHPFQAAYLDPIVERIVTEDARTRAQSEARVERTTAQVQAQREWTTSPKPDTFPKVRA